MIQYEKDTLLRHGAICRNFSALCRTVGGATMDILSQMTDSLLRYAKITSQIIGVPITIINRDLFRINYEGGRDSGAATHGRSFHGRARRHCRRGCYFGESQVMLEPRTHPACKTCPNFDACFDQAEIWYRSNTTRT